MNKGSGFGRSLITGVIMDIILYNGKVHSMAGFDAEAVAIEGGRITAVGSSDEVLAMKTEGTRLVDLEGRCVLPGFTDTHMHIVITGLFARQIDLTPARSLDDIIRMGREYVEKTELHEGDWIVGYGFDHSKFDVPVLPDRKTADAISTEYPVILDRICGHVGAVNSKAIEIAGYTEESEIHGGRFGKYEDGSLNGILEETALEDLKKHMTRLGKSKVKTILKETGALFASAGLTAVHSDDVGPEGTTWENLKAATEELEADNAAVIRIFEEWEAPNPKALESSVLKQRWRTCEGMDFLKVCNVKILSDGSLGACSAYMREPYCGSDSRGIAVYTQDEIDDIVSACHRNNLQVACHAIGDGGCEMFVNAVEKAQKECPKDLRHRVVHCECGDDALYARMGRLKMGADAQPAFVPSDAKYLDERWGKRAAKSCAWKSLLENGVHVGGGSDCPVESFSPIYGIHCAVNRPYTHDCQGTFYPEECLSVKQAVEMYTVTPAWLSKSEKDLGTVEKGKMADLVVLDRDIFTVPKDEIKEIKVCMTIVDGRVSYEA